MANTEETKTCSMESDGTFLPKTLESSPGTDILPVSELSQDVGEDDLGLDEDDSSPDNLSEIWDDPDDLEFTPNPGPNLAPADTISDAPGNEGAYARRHVEDWQIRNVGNRPEDHLARICLFGSLFRDYRVRHFHRLTKEPKAWVLDMVPARFTQNERRQAVNYLTLYYHHLYRLAQYQVADQMKTADYHGEGDADLENNTPDFNGQTLDRLWRCIPNTVLLGYEKGQSKVCGRSRLCPWCFARYVNRLFDAIRLKVLPTNRWKYLVLGKAEPFDEPFGGLTGYDQERDTAALFQTWPMIRGHTSNRYFGIDGERMRYTRNAQMFWMKKDASEWGIRDGLVTHQVGSGQISNGRRTYRHQVALIGGLDESTYQEFLDDEDSPFSGTSALILGTKSVRVRWMVVEASETGLRALLAGTAFGYVPPDSIVTGLTAEDFRSGFNGALSWEPTFLMDDQLWPTYMVTTAKLPIYQAFGAWKQLIRNTTHSPRWYGKQFGIMQKKRPDNIAAHRKKAQQQKVNQDRKDQTDKKLKSVLPIARLVWRDVQAIPHSGRPGRKPEKQLLVRGLRDRGVELTGNSLVKLLKKLRSNVPPGPTWTPSTKPPS